MVLVSGPGLHSLLAQALKLLCNVLFGLIGFARIIISVVNNVKHGGELDLKVRVALQAIKKVGGV